MSDDNQLWALERITKLRDAGTLSEEQFAEQKGKILAGQYSVRIYRRLWFVVLLTCIILTFPLALLILATGSVYKRNKDKSFTPIKNTTRYIYASVLGLWLAAVVVDVASSPQSISQHWAESANPDLAQSTDNKAASAAPEGAQSKTAQGTPASPINGQPMPAQAPAPQPNAVQQSATAMPPDERDYVSRYDALFSKIKNIQMGTRAFQDGYDALKAFLVSRNGQPASNWTCTAIDDADVTHGAATNCSPENNPESFFQVWFDQNTEKPPYAGMLYKGDVLSVTGTIVDPDDSNGVVSLPGIHASSITVLQKGP